MSGEEIKDPNVEEEVVPVEDVDESIESEGVEKETLEEENDDGHDIEEKPFWLQDEDAEEMPDSSDAVPEAALINAKRKLKGKIKERDEEIEKLRAENDVLKHGAQPQISQAALPKRPRLSDFDTDDEYEDAMDKYESDKLAWQHQQLQSKTETTQKIEQRKLSIAKSVDSHYLRAEKLVSETDISPNIYDQADTTLRQAIDEIMPGQGDQIFDWLTSVIGDGSEKTLFYVGRNKAALAEFKGLLSSDKSGLAAAFHLGKVTERISGPKKQSSRVPNPAPQANGDLGVNSKEKAAIKKYKELHKAGNAQGAYEIKKQAKKDGIDVSKWS